MTSTNFVMLVGHLGLKPEAKETDTTTILNLSVATNRRVKKGDEYVEQTDWHRVVCFGNTAKFIAKYADKGALISVEGRLQTRHYDDDGKQRYITEVIANRVKLLSKSNAKDIEKTQDDYTKAKDGLSDIPY